MNKYALEISIEKDGKNSIIHITVITDNSNDAVIKTMNYLAEKEITTIYYIIIRKINDDTSL